MLGIPQFVPLVRKLGALLVMFALAGCITVGNKFDPNVVNKLTPGISTEADATQLLGKPTAISSLAGGTELLQWQYSEGTIVGGSGAHVAILFGPDQKMIRITHQFSTN